MRNLSRRLDLLERQLGMKPGPRVLVFTPCLEDPEPEETPYSAKIAPDVWVTSTVPLTSEEIEQLRAELASGKGSHDGTNYKDTVRFRANASIR
jgi:hypothetical protein